MLSVGVRKDDEKKLITVAFTFFWYIKVLCFNRQTKITSNSIPQAQIPLKISYITLNISFMGAELIK